MLMLPFLTIGCKKNDGGAVPETLVDINLYINNPSYINLSAAGGWVYVAGGVRGIIVYRLSSTEFRAYDRNCTYEPSDPCSVVSMDNTDIQAVDTCCNSKFLIVDGSITQGPAILPLKMYNTTYDGSIVHIYN